ncbi:MAG: BolA family protein [Solirubrobacteraceae bacterium]
MEAIGADATPEELKARIEAGIPGATAEVTGDGHHFYAVVNALAFQGLPRIAQHRLVYDVFGPEVGGRIHALSIQTKAPPSGAAENSHTESIA